MHWLRLGCGAANMLDGTVFVAQSQVARVEPVGAVVTTVCHSLSDEATFCCPVATLHLQPP